MSTSSARRSGGTAPTLSGSGLLALLIVAVGVVVHPAEARAGDFWDDVRQPGRSAYRAHVQRARSALAARRTDDALEATSVAIDTLPDEPEAHALRAIALGESGDPAGMAQEAERALALDGDVYAEPVWGSRAALLFATHGQPALAARVLRRTLATMPATHLRRQLYTLLGDVAQALGPESLQEAARAYRVALKSGPADSRTILGLGLALHRLGQREEADLLLRRAAAPGSLDQLIAGLPVAPTERAARAALLALVRGDREAARAAFEVAEAGSPHAAWAAAARAELSAAGPSSARPRPRPRSRTRRPR